MLTIPGKIPIRIHPFFWVLIFLLGWINSEAVQPMFIWAGVILVSVLVHEFGHALTAVAFGQNAQIDLVAMGGLTSRTGPTLKLWQEFVIVLNGPLAGLALYFIANFWLQHVAKDHHPYLAYALVVGVLVNLWWTLLNLIPILPMDGGRLMSILLELIFGLKGVKMALFVSMLLAGALAIFFFYLGNYLVGSILLMFMYESYRNWQGSLIITDSDRDLKLQRLVAEAENDAAHGRVQEGIEKFERVLRETGKGILYNSAAQHLALLYANQGKYSEAIQLLAPLRTKLSADTLNLLQKLFYRTGELKKSIDYGTQVFQLSPDYQIALTNALSFAQLGDVKPTIGWLQASLREGLPNMRDVLRMSEFDKIRHDPQFEEFARQTA